MDPISVGLLLAVAGGAGGEVGRQAWAALSSLVRRPFRHGPISAERTDAPSGMAELEALEVTPTDRTRAQALSEALAIRAASDPDFRVGLEAWQKETQLIQVKTGEVRNEISGSSYGPVIGAGYIGSLSFGASATARPAELVIDWSGSRFDYHNNAVFASFALTNTGDSIAVIDEIRIEVLDTYPTSEHENSWIGAVMQEFKFNVELDPSQLEYAIADDLKLYYKSGDIDSFKIKFSSRRRLFYKLGVRVQWHEVNDKQAKVIATDPFLAHFPYI